MLVIVGDDEAYSYLHHDGNNDKLLSMFQNGLIQITKLIVG